MPLTYTESQLEAIGHRDGNLLILACAGSGKTEVISRRIAELVHEGVPRSAIAAFTFMERAAEELKARIRLHLEDLDPDDPSLGDMYVGTVHSFCLQLLKELDSAYRGYEVMDEARQAALLVSNYYKLGLQALQPRTGNYTETIKRFIATLNVMHTEGIDVDGIDDPQLVASIVAYRELAHQRPNLFFDFNSIIDELIRRLRTDETGLAAVRERFRYLVVDEYQDIDPRQEELISLLSDDGTEIFVTAVGDDDQAIFGWRGTDVQNILTFEDRYPDVSRVRLQDNFRSTHGVVEIANAAIQRLPADQRLGKQMFAARWEGVGDARELVERLAEPGDLQRQTFPSAAREAAWVADRIEGLLGVQVEERSGARRALHYSDMAVLLRTVSKCGQVFVDEFDARGIPYVVRGTGGLLGTTEVRLISALFALLAERDFFKYPVGGGTPQSLPEADTRQFVRDACNRLRASGDMPLANGVAVLGWVARKRAELNRQMLPREERGRLSRRIYPQSIFHEMLGELGAGETDGAFSETVLYNLGRLSSIITDFEAVHQWVTPRDLPGFLIFLGYWGRQADAGAGEEVGSPVAVQILTVHKAKGLEWPVVFLPQISSRIFPHQYRNRPVETFLPAGIFDGRRYATEDVGERRLWYVGLTRCRKFLHVSSEDRSGKRPQQFLTEIQHDLMRDDGIDPTERERGQPTAAQDVELFPTTFSDLNYYWQCPADYRLRNLMGFGPGVREAYGYGQQIHNLLAELHERARQGEVLDEHAVAELVDRRFNLRYTRGRPLEALRRAAARSVIRYVNEFEDHAELVLEAEKPFEYIDRESGALISGTIDLLERIRSGPEGEEKVPVCVVDFKTHRWDEAESFFRRVDEVTTQLRLYALAARAALNLDPQDAAAHFLSPNPPSQELRDRGVEERVSINVSEGTQEDVRQRVSETVAAIQAQLFPRHGAETGRCPRCDFQSICPGFRESANEGQRSAAPSAANEREVQMVMDEQGVGAE